MKPRFLLFLFIPGFILFLISPSRSCAAGDTIPVIKKCCKPQDVHGWTNNGHPCINHVEWSPPDCISANHIRHIIFDDGSWENAWEVTSGSVASLGNQFPVASTLTGVIQSIDLYFVSNGSCVPQPRSINIYDGNQKLIGSTGTFIPAPTDQWITVKTPDIPFTGAFYIMVLWNNVNDCYYLAADTNGSYVPDNLSWYFDGTAWCHPSKTPGVFLLRATALAGSDLKKIVLTPGGTDTATLAGYNIYRFPGHSKSDTIKLNGNPITETMYLDTLSSSDDYKYLVSAVYNDHCESEGSLIDYGLGCTFFVDEHSDNERIKIYPNPASDFIAVSSDSQIAEVKLVNSQGTTCYDNKTVKNTSARVSISELPSGLYFIFVNTETVSATQKVIIIHR